MLSPKPGLQAGQIEGLAQGPHPASSPFPDTKQSGHSQSHIPIRSCEAETEKGTHLPWAGHSTLSQNLAGLRKLTAWCPSSPLLKPISRQRLHGVYFLCPRPVPPAHVNSDQVPLRDLGAGSCWWAAGPAKTRVPPGSVLPCSPSPPAPRPATPVVTEDTCFGCCVPRVRGLRVRLPRGGVERPGPEAAERRFGALGRGGK